MYILTRRLHKFSVFLVEFINSTCGVNELHLTGKERVRVSSNLKLDEWVFLAVCPSGGFS